MKNTAFILTGDYWHPTETIIPAIELMLPDDKWDVRITEDPAEFLSMHIAPDLFVTFKDSVENDQNPTPIWCGDNWSCKLKKRINDDGMGFLAVHCGLTDLPKEHIITREILRAQFITHPPQCEVKFVPDKSHPITENVTEFTFPAVDEHYVIEMLSDFPTEILGVTVSKYGKQPALWAHTLGKGRVCGITPGHSTDNLICSEYLNILKNAAEWCARKHIKNKRCATYEKI